MYLEIFFKSLILDYPFIVKGFPGGTVVKNPACQCRGHKRCRFDPWVEKILGEEMVICSSILAWKIPWAEEPAVHGVIGCSPWGRKESDTTEQLSTQSTFIVKSKI